MKSITTEKKKKEILKDAECTGVYCPHEMVEKHYVFTQGWLDLLEKTVREEIAKDINGKNFSLMEECEPDCDAVRHAYHQGSWDHFFNLDRFIEEKYLKQTSSEKEDK